MPELPEVETMVRGIRPHVEGRRIAAVRRCRCPYRPIDIAPSMRSISARSQGQRITAVRRFAKRVILELESGDMFIIEPRMTGLMLVSDPPDGSHLRFEWRMETDTSHAHPSLNITAETQKRRGRAETRKFPIADSALSPHLRASAVNRNPITKGQASDDFSSQFAIPNLQFAISPPSLWFWDRRGLGTVRLFSPEEMAVSLGPSRFGPDALAMTLDDWRERLARTRRPVKVALLDQMLVAGIGNLYASEILHLARIHPACPADRLSRPQIERLHAATRSILETAIRHEGSTLADGTYRNALNQNGSYQNQHRVYARTGERCPVCLKGIIQRVVQAQRSTFFCPRCQRPPRRFAASRRRACRS